MTVLRSCNTFPFVFTDVKAPDMAIFEESPIVNGVNVEELALNSSRTRRHRNSYGPRSRRGSSSDDLSPQHRIISTEDGSMRDERKNSSGGPSPVHVAKQNRNSFEESDKLIVDVNSLKMMLEGGNIEFNEDSEEEEDDTEILKMKPIPRPKQQKSSNRKLDEDYSPAKHLLQGRRQTEPDTQTKLSISKTTGDNLKSNGHAVKHPMSNGTLEDEVGSLSRTRANAIDKRSSPILRTKAQKAKPDPTSVEEMKELEKPPLRSLAKSPEPSRDTKKKELRNSASIQVEDAEVRRSGSWKRYKQFSGDQALGIFYHNRRSQLIDSEALDEAERKLQERSSSVERSDSSSPHSPLLRPRDSRGVSPHPQSPLAIRGSGIFERGMAEREKGLEVVSENSAGAPVTEETEDDLEVSGYLSSFCCYNVTCRELALTLLPLLSSPLLSLPSLFTFTPEFIRDVFLTKAAATEEAHQSCGAQTEKIPGHDGRRNSH